MPEPTSTREPRTGQEASGWAPGARRGSTADRASTSVDAPARHAGTDAGPESTAGTESTAGEPTLSAAALDAVKRYFLSEETLGDTLTRVTDLGRLAVGSDLAGITMIVDGAPTTAVFSDPEAAEIDEHQYAGSGGPCLEAFLTGRTVRITSVPDDRRWPEFERVATRHGIRCTLSLPLPSVTDPLGALNLYWRSDHPLGAEVARVGQEFADHAGVVLANAQALQDSRELSDHLNQALVSRATIDYAVGILMSPGGRSPDEAFQLLVRASQRENRKLREIATDIVRRVQDKAPPPARATPPA